MEIGRNYYLNKLIMEKHNGLVKVITGIHCCGKSYLLLSLFKNHLLESGVDGSHIIEILLEASEYGQFRNPDVLYPYIKEKISDDKTYYVFLDEVQLLGEFESVLNGLLHIRNVDVYVTASSADLFSDGANAQLCEKCENIRLHPLTFAEFMSAYHGNKYDGLKEYASYGSLPPVVLLSSREEKVHFLKRLCGEKYFSGIKNREEFASLVSLLASKVGSFTNPGRLSNFLRREGKSAVSVTTVKNYLDRLCGAFVINKTFRYDIKGKRRIGTPQKYYFSDIGLCGAGAGFCCSEDGIAENIIYCELIARDFEVEAGFLAVGCKDENGNPLKGQLDVNFVCSKGLKRYLVHSAVSAPEGSLESAALPLLCADDFFKKVLITENTPAPHYIKGVLVMSIYDFLLRPDSLEL